MKKILLTITALLVAFGAISQTTNAAPGGLPDPLLPLYLTAAAVLFVLIVVIGVAIYVIRILKYLTEQTLARTSTEMPTTHSAGNWWSRLVLKMNASVPIDQEKNIELEHSYDGIRELDNHLPPWWKWLFYGSIGWAVVYFVVFHVTDSLPLSQAEYQHELALAEEQVRQYKASQPQADVDENALVFALDVEIIEKGKSIFLNNNCGGCHRPDGGGNSIGPNLTDEYWLHGGEIKHVFLTIKNGVVEKGMPAWGKSMTAQDVRDVAFFVMSLQGTNPPDPKAPQGIVFKSVNVTADSTSTQARL
jgi:cytochrome c oxidase cbb3-type subunit III